MATNFSVEPSKLTKAASDIRTKADAIQNNFKQIFNRVNELAKVWDSDDGRKFQQDMKSYEDDFNALYKALCNSAQGIQGAGEIYKKAQES